LTRYWPLDWRSCFGQQIKWDAPSFFGLWTWLLEASHYGHPSREAKGVHGHKFGLWAYTLPTLDGVGHQWTEGTSTGCNQWLTLAKIALKMPHAGRSCSLVVNTSRCGEGINLRRLHTMLGQRLQFLYFISYVFPAHFFGLSTKVGHSLPRPLDLDGHSVKRP
jgi:hypothetical protein